MYPSVFPDSSQVSNWLFALATALVFFLSVLLHEFGHAVVARAYGLPVRSITLFMLGGVAQVGQEMQRPGVELLIAGAEVLVGHRLTAAGAIGAWPLPGPPPQRNFIINPAHPDSARITVEPPFDVVWDGRLFGPPTTRL